LGALVYLIVSLVRLRELPVAIPVAVVSLFLFAAVWFLPTIALIVLAMWLVALLIVNLVRGQPVVLAGSLLVFAVLLATARLFLPSLLDQTNVKPLLLSSLMLTAVVLLSFEWLTRKLLKLA
jgi:hypothetical protein